MGGRFLVPLVLALLAGCGPERAAPSPGAALQQPGPTALLHDFGVLPHGEARQHDFVFDLDRLARPDTRYVPLRAHIECSCGRTQMIVRGADGREREVDGRPDPTNAPGPGETLLVRLFLDTITKPAVDLPPATSRGHLLLQPVGDRDGSRRVTWPFVVQFAIDAPVVLHPLAELDFGSVPESHRPTLATTLRGDERHRDVRFGAITCTSPDVQATLTPEGDGFVLRATCTPREPGNQRAVLQIATDLPTGYSVNLGVTWKVVPDLQAAPLPKVSFRADMTRPQTEDECRSQYVLVVDHDPARPPEFVVREITADDGRDALAHFAATLAPVPGSSRQQRLFVRYLGGLSGTFRGRIVLGKAGSTAPTLPIELAVFPRP